MYIIKKDESVEQDLNSEEDWKPKPYFVALILTRLNSEEDWKILILPPLSELNEFS